VSVIRKNLDRRKKAKPQDKRSMMNAESDPVEPWFTVLCALPLHLIITAYAEACFGVGILSHWPRPNLDDPKHLASGTLHVLWQILMFSVIPAGIALGMLAARHWPA
jgi:hypothetical protein